VRIAGSAASNQQEGAGKVALEVELVRYKNKEDKTGEKIVWGQEGVVLHGGDRIGIRVRNRSKFDVDLTILFVDSQFGISPFFPDDKDENRLTPDQTTPWLRASITDNTIGFEHVTIIAVRAQGQWVDFTALAQPALETVLQRGAQKRAVESTFGKLAQAALFAKGTTRGSPVHALDDYSIRVISWKTLPRGSKQE
jgi:hypothetical protein